MENECHCEGGEVTDGKKGNRRSIRMACIDDRTSRPQHVYMQLAT